MSRLKEYIDELNRLGYKRTVIKEQIAKAAKITSIRAVDRWEKDVLPDVKEAQYVAHYLSHKLRKKITIEKLWPVENGE